MQTLKYFYGLDILRASMMLLGIFIHAALLVNYYDIGYKSGYEKNFIISIINYCSTLFRMETFFILAGFFSALLIKNKSKDFFLKNRFTRIFIPLLFGIIFSNGIVGVVFFKNSTLEFNIGGFLSHLWFLLCLYFISLIFSKFYSLYNKYLLNVDLGGFFVLTVFFFISKNIAYIGYENIKILLLSEIIKYFLLLPFEFFYYFIIGALIYDNNNAIKRVCENVNIIFLVILFGISIYLYQLKIIESNNIGFFLNLVKGVSDFLIGVFFSLYVFNLFYKIKKSNVSIGFLVDSSLVVYIFHFPFIFIYGRLLDGVYNSVYVYYFSVCAYTFITCIAIYLVFSLFRFTRYMFGIKSNLNKKNRSV